MGIQILLAGPTAQNPIKLEVTNDLGWSDVKAIARAFETTLKARLERVLVEFDRD